MTRIICLLLLLFSSQSLMGQDWGEKFLSLEKPSKFKRQKLYPGDSIRFRFQGEKHVYGSRIKAIHSNSITLYEDSIPLSDFSDIILPRKRLSRYWILMLGFNMQIAALWYTPMPFLNQRWHDITFMTVVRTVAISTGLILGGWAIRKLKNKRFRLNRKWQLQILKGNGLKGMP